MARIRLIGESSMSDSINETDYKIRPFVDANIAEIQQPGKYRIVGKIVSMDETSILLDDGFDQITITIPEELSLKLEDGITIRAFGYVNIQPEKQMKTTFIQDFNKVDIDSYRKLNELEQSLRKANT
jgi:hypothetical protein